MTLNFSFNFSKPSNLRRLKTWGADAGMVADGYTEGGIDQFAFIKVYQLDEIGAYIGDMSANNVGPTLNHGDMLKIAALQVSDEYSVDMKMQWMTGYGIDEWGSLMRIVGGGEWETAPVIRMIGAVYAGNVVEVLERRTFKAVRYNGVVADVSMSRIRTFNPLTDWGKTYFTHPQLVHSVMAVGRGDIPHKPRGNVYMPILSKYPSVWVFDRWLEQK